MITRRKLLTAMAPLAMMPLTLKDGVALSESAELKPGKKYLFRLNTVPTGAELRNKGIQHMFRDAQEYLQKNGIDAVLVGGDFDVFELEK